MSRLITALLVAGSALPSLAQAPKARGLSEPGTPPAPVLKVAEPFAFADFTWLNGNSRQKDAILDTKYFTGEFRADLNYVYDFNHPQDHIQTLAASLTSVNLSLDSDQRP